MRPKEISDHRWSMVRGQRFSAKLNLFQEKLSMVDE
jgi:hypothetical protein